jgi:hypothetical protein
MKTVKTDGGRYIRYELGGEIDACQRTNVTGVSHGMISQSNKEPLTTLRHQNFGGQKTVHPENSNPQGIVYVQYYSILHRTSDRCPKGLSTPKLTARENKKYEM